MDMDIGSARIIHMPANFASKKMERTTKDFAGFIGDVLYMSKTVAYKGVVHRLIFDGPGACLPVNTRWQFFYF
jgi:hypothetical protein